MGRVASPTEREAREGGREKRERRSVPCVRWHKTTGTRTSRKGKQAQALPRGRKASLKVTLCTEVMEPLSGSWS